MSDQLRFITYGIKQVLFYRFDFIGGETINLFGLIIFFLAIIMTFWVSRLMRRAIETAFRLRGINDERTVGVIKRLTHYGVLLIGFGISLQIIGIDLQALFAAGAVFAVGLGFALKNITENFMSGIILLMEASIRPGDVLMIDDEMVRVREMKIRSTVVQTRDGDCLIVPNSVLVSDAVRNYTLGRGLYRMNVPVGVSYRSDMAKVRSVLEDVALNFPQSSDLKSPLVEMSSFGDSAVVFDVRVWIEDPWGLRVRTSQLHEALWKALQAEGIVIAFPQVDLHVDPEVIEGITRLSLVE